MRYRCLNPKSNGYRDYGGRGIKIYPDWIDSPVQFIEWIEANLGPRPEGYSLDRIDNDGNYEPGNLRWANKETQQQNRRPYRRTGPLLARIAELEARIAELEAVS